MSASARISINSSAVGSPYGVTTEGSFEASELPCSTDLPVDESSPLINTKATSISKSVSTRESHEPRETRYPVIRTWSKMKYFVIPVEVIPFFFLFTMTFNIQISQQFFFQRVFIDALADGNFSMNSTSGCLKEEHIVKLTGEDFFIEKHRIVNNYNMGSTLAYVIPSIVLTVLIGPLSDHFGRKPFIFLVAFGQVLTPVVGIAVVHFRLDVPYIFMGSLATGILGGFGAMLSSTFAYITDITPKAWLTIRMGTLEASFFLASAVSAGLANVIVDLVNCDFAIPMWVMLSTALIALLFSVLLPESLTDETKIKNAHKSKKGFRMLMRGFQLLLWKSYLTKHLLEVWIIIIIMSLSFFNVTGIVQTILYFLHNKPLEWKYSIIGIYQATSSISHLLVLVIILPVLVLLKVPDIAISFMGVLLACGTCVFIALLNKSWEMFLAGIILGFEVLVTPGLRTRIAHVVNEKDIGAVFSVIAVCQLLSTLLSTIIFNEVYSPGTGSNHKASKGDSRTPQTIYWVAAAIWCVAGILLIIIFVVSKKHFDKKNGSFFVNANIFHRNKYGGVSQ